MIDQHTVDRIIAAADITEVVGDFVTLKKRGTNHLGLCPFHNEKTPSFTVSPAKGIFKCFGCGKGGNSVNFIMEHEHMSYVEALKFLARKYHIEVVEKEVTPEELQQRNERESLMVVTAYAQRYFSDNLHKHSDGKTIGMAYFRERGFRDDTIEKFQLGYCLDQRDAFTKTAIREGYKLDFLVKTGLTIQHNEDTFDRFQGRVMFPIHSISGRVTAFGGRILKTDKKFAKYLNSPESEIYHKSGILYGIFHAKKSITQENKCFLVEGYTDVISLHQAGVENVVASSGTSLTIDQIRLIKRFTPNVTILYDGDAAGIKASIRGIDLVLEEGLNVKVALLPDGEDPDSYARSHSASEVLDFIAKNETDFITFKTRILLDEAKVDPIKRAGLISDIVRSISVIPDSIIRSVYIKDCSRLLDIQENVLYTEVASNRRKKMEQVLGKIPAEAEIKTTPPLPGFVTNVSCEEQEKEIVYFMLRHGNVEFWKPELNDDNQESPSVSIGQYIINEILNDDLEFKNLVYQKIFNEYLSQLDINPMVDNRYFVNHPDSQISQVAVDFLSTPHKLSKIWAKHQAFSEEDIDFLHRVVPKAIIVYKSKIMKLAIKKLHDDLVKLDIKNQVEETNGILKKVKTLNDLQNTLSKELDRIVL
ncbi:MAG: DNA primase [Bacteroidales bacterium]|nr:MAG: DNA primase [Bacteroidales bacterium]